MSDLRRSKWFPLIVHLRLHYQLVLLSPLFIWGFLLGGKVPSIRAGLGFLAFHVFLYGGITAYNSYYDRDEGPVGGLRFPPPVSEALLGFSLAVQAIGLVIALFVGIEFTVLYLIVMVLIGCLFPPALALEGTSDSFPICCCLWPRCNRFRGRVAVRQLATEAVVGVA
jgi:hypothetical protein